MKKVKQRVTANISKVRYTISRYERHVSAAAFIFGFISDSLILPRIDSYVAYLILGTYLTLAMVLIFFSVLADSGHAFKKYIRSVVPVLPFAIQFLFGSLMSAIFVYYSRSANVIESAPFMVLLLLIVVGNELFRERLRRLEFQISILFFVMFMAMSFAIPVFLGSIGPSMFLISGGVALSIITIFILILRAVASAMVARGKRVFIGSIAAILLVMNALYFSHLIPPIPLSLRVAGVYHTVVRGAEGVYVVTTEQTSMLERVIHSYPVVHVSGEPLYFFTAVFAPTTFNTAIVHLWQFYDEDTKTWETKYRFPFTIVGGRDGGYRGYSIKNNVIPGYWRVRVETPRGELIGSETFLAKLATEPVVFIEREL